MVKISRILLPVDFSERCLGITPYARTFAEKYDAEIVLLHVINPVFITPEIGMAPPAAISVPQWMSAEKSKLLAEFATQHLSGLRVRRLIYEGIPETQIVEIAKSEDVDMVIMTTHGYGIFRRFLIGSVAAKVLDDLPNAIFTGVHMEKQVHNGKEDFSTVACAVDMKAISSQTLVSAAQLATDFDARLGVIHVCPPPGQGHTANAADLQPQLEELVASELAKHNLTFAPGRITSRVQSGEIAHTICDFVDRIGARVLVIGRDHDEEHGGLSSGRLRTQTYSIIRQSTCPVLSL
jgi:nucleotide-binding universal stress UspA family protein